MTESISDWIRMPDSGEDLGAVMVTHVLRGDALVSRWARVFNYRADQLSIPWRGRNQGVAARLVGLLQPGSCLLALLPPMSVSPIAAVHSEAAAARQLAPQVGR